MKQATALYAKTGTVTTTTGNTGAITCDGAELVAIDIGITAITGTGPSITFTVERLDANGTYRVIHTTAALSATGSTVISIGPGCTVTHVLTSKLRVNWTVAGTTPSVTFDLSVIGSSVG